MTVIASYNPAGCAIVIADTLINGPVGEAGPPQTVLPTLGNVSNFFSGSWAINKSSQKVCIITDYCALAWADSQLQARHFITRLRRLSGRIRITRDVMKKLFDKLGTHELQLAGAILEEDQLHTFSIGCEQFECPILGEVHCGGSGASVVHDFAPIMQSIAPAPPGEDEISAYAASIALTQVAHLLNAEFRKGDSADSLLEFFGGGYEMAVFYDGRFHKLSANFVFLDISINPMSRTLRVGNPKLIIAQTYCGDTLKYEAIVPKSAEEDEVTRHDHIEIPPFAHPSARKGDPSMQEDINWGCFVFVDNFKHGGAALASIIVRSQTPPIEYRVTDGQLTFEYSESAGRQISAYINAHYL
ncbi:hypothetical protein [Pseudomonas xantholysinigenes]|uniref:Uncharacterized protein n=1 Tax=Pseudomonas xantholysinigenes TaxID=2745490 RepID=A0A9E6TYS9_9PSED|nr:hypothetical protein [Pseudomonas xantholysinigenes]QXI40793.1 hypothetical protein HU772_012215 [Pseudomonas xantholysinigenes]